MSLAGGFITGCVMIIISAVLFETCDLARVRDTDWHVLLWLVGAFTQLAAMTELVAAWVLTVMAGPPR